MTLPVFADDEVPGGADAHRGLLTAALGLTVLAAIAVVGLAWAKWLPHAGKAHTLASTHVWDGSSALATSGASPSLHGAVDFALVYGKAIWKALVVSLLIAAGLDALVPKRWVVRLLTRRSGWRQAGWVVCSPCRA